MAISWETVIAFVAVLAVAVFCYIKLVPMFKQFIETLVPYPQVSGFLTTMISFLVVVVAVDAAVKIFLSTGILSTDAEGWLRFITESTGLARDILSTILQGIYYGALLYIGVNIARVASSFQNKK